MQSFTLYSQSEQLYLLTTLLKIQTKSKITLIAKKIVSSEGEKESEEIISEDKAMANVFNRSFTNIVPNLNISMKNDFDTIFLKTEDPILNAISKYRIIEVSS